MTDKEFKRLSRAQLIDIIYQLQLKQKTLEDEKQELEAEVSDKRIRLRQAGNIAEASLAIHKVMQSAQDAAEQYLEEIRILQQETEEKSKHLLEKAQKDADAIILNAQKEAHALIAQTKKELDSMKDQARKDAEALASRKKQAKLDIDSAVEAILKEYTQKTGERK